jgi:hypothetical protein
MANKRFRLIARISTSDPRTIKPVLKKSFREGSVKEEDGEFIVEAEMEGENAKELNRALVSSLRRAVKKTRLRAEWTSDDGTTEKFFDYVLKKTTTT